MALRKETTKAFNAIKKLRFHSARVLSTNVNSPDFLPGCPVKSDFFQASLPRLPIPKLDKTCEKYLASQRVLLNDEDYTRTEKLTSDFLNNEGLELNHRLIARNKQNKHTSYVSGPWFDMYLKDRNGVAFNHNPCIVYKDDPTEKNNEQSIRATNFIVASMKFKKSLESNTLRPEVFHLSPEKTNNDAYWNYIKWFPKRIATYGSYVKKVFPLDMSQYKNLFNSTRIPRKEKDELWVDKEARHVTVMRRGRFYCFDVLNNDGSIVDERQLLSNIRHILQDNRPVPDHPLGYLTAGNRDAWAKARDTLIAEGNSEQLRLVDGGAFMLTLDDLDSEDNVDIVRNFLHGDGANRWFDKSFSLILDKKGHAGINFEHAWGDGVAVVRYFNECFDDTTKSPRVVGGQEYDLPAPQVHNIEFNINDELRSTIDETRKYFQGVVDSLSLNYAQVLGTGRKTCKSMGISPDSMMQLLFQMTFYRMHGQTVPTYESCSTAIYRHGRTETIRPATLATKTACELFGKTSGTLPNLTELQAAVKECSKVHTELTKNAAMGKGWDRHLFALKNLAMESGSLPELFQDPAYVKINQNIISTSTLTSSALLIGSFCPVVRDGFGVGYGIEKDQLGCTVSTYPERNSDAFVDTFKSCVEDIKKAFNV